MVKGVGVGVGRGGGRGRDRAWEWTRKRRSSYEGGGGDGGGRLEVIRQGERLCDKGAWRRQGRRRRQGTGKSDFRQEVEVEGEKGGVVAVRVDGQWSEMCAVGEGTLNSPGERWRLLGRNNRALTKEFRKTESAEDVVGGGLGVRVGVVLYVWSPRRPAPAAPVSPAVCRARHLPVRGRPVRRMGPGIGI